MKIKIFAFALIATGLFFSSCDLMNGDSGDESGTVADNFSLVINSPSQSTLPDTIEYGDSVVFSLAISDTSGDSVMVAVAGLPPGLAASTQQAMGNTTVSFTLRGSRLVADSLYHIVIFAKGSGLTDTLTQMYDVFIQGPDDYSLVAEVVSLDSLPDTLYHGDTTAFSLQISDRGGDSVIVSVTGLPPAVMVHHVPTANASTLSFNLHSGLVTPGLLYNIGISARGSGAGDTLSLLYPVLAGLPDLYTLWSQVVSQDAAIPDTLHAGEIVTYILKIGDSDGDPVSISISGLPPGANMIISDDRDTALVTLILNGDSLPYDALYNIAIHANGATSPRASGLDTLTLSSPMLVLDTNRLGGIRKLAKDMWWNETQLDTISSTKIFYKADSMNKSIKHIEHRKHSQVLNVKEVDGWPHYLIFTEDTLLKMDSIAKNAFWVRHTDSIVDHLMPGWLGDTLRLTTYKLPIEVGTSWQALSYAWDTSLSFEVSPNSFIPFSWYLTADGSAEVLSTATRLFDGKQQNCFENFITSDMRSVALIDTTIDTLIYPGDTTAITRTTSTNRQFVNTFFTIPLESHEIEIKYDTNFFDSTAFLDTIVKHSTLTSWYHPILDRVIKKE